MRICLDEHVPVFVGVWLEAEGHDVALAAEVAGRGARDEELLRLCAQERRVLLTNDRDFDELHRVVYHAGILTYSVNQPTKEGWRKIVRGIGLIDRHAPMRNELQWPGQWTRDSDQ